MTALQTDVESLAARFAAGDAPLILDVREPWEFELCRLEGAVNIPLGQLPARFSAADYPADRDLVVVCHHGMRSMQATMWLRRQGIETATNLTGGIDAWAARIDPAMSRY